MNAVYHGNDRETISYMVNLAKYADLCKMENRKRIHTSKTERGYPMHSGTMFNTYPDSIGNNLTDTVSFLSAPEMKDAFRFFYILPDGREELLKKIREVLKPDHVSVRKGLSMIAVTGEKDPGSSNANSRVLQALSAEGIEISTINQGAGKLNLLIGIPEENYDQAIRIIYRTLENS